MKREALEFRYEEWPKKPKDLMIYGQVSQISDRIPDPSELTIDDHIKDARDHLARLIKQKRRTEAGNAAREGQK